jgi:hypothetical protein
MKKVYALFLKSEGGSYDDAYSNSDLISIHETAEGARKRAGEWVLMRNEVVQRKCSADPCRTHESDEILDQYTYWWNKDPWDLIPDTEWTSIEVWVTKHDSIEFVIEDKELEE